jgi:hypothetical protein
MKAISVKQPWAELIARAEKTIETRTWQTKYRGDLLICASAKPAEWLKMRPKIVHPSKGIWCDARDDADEDFEFFYHFSKALCIVELYDVEKMNVTHEVDAVCQVYPGAYAWHLRNIRCVDPFFVKGQLNLFNVEIPK